MRVLITGAYGFIGRHLQARLLEEPENQLYLLDRVQPVDLSLSTVPGPSRSIAGIFPADLRDAQQIQRVLRSVQPDVIFHLAAVGVGDPFLVVEDALEHNLYGTLNLLHAAFSTESSIQQPQKIIISRTPGEYSAMNPYAASKAAAWDFCRMFARTKGWPIVGAAIFQAYGPGQPEQRILPAAMIAALNGGDFPMTAGQQERDWIYISDVVSGLIAIRDGDLLPGTTAELGSGYLTSVAAVVQRIYALVGGRGRALVGALPTRPGEEARQRAHVEGTLELTGWQTAVTLDEGLSATIEFLSHRHHRHS